jgi:flagellar biosynthetic protein FlhF
MQVKKFEAPTIAEALKLVKAELGPEAIILSTKNHKKGFGLLSKASVEVTAAVADKSLAKKQITERLVPQNTKDAIGKLSATKQNEIYNDFSEYVDRRRSERMGFRTEEDTRGSQRAQGARTGPPDYARAKQEERATDQAGKTTTPTTKRYADITDDEEAVAAPQAPAYARNGRAVGEQRAVSGDQSQYRSQEQSPSQYTAPQHTAAPSRQPRNTPTPAYGGGLETETDRSHPSQWSSPSMSKVNRQGEQVSALEDEIKRLKLMMEELKSEQTVLADTKIAEATTDELQGEFNNLLRNGIDKRYASALIKQVAFALPREHLRYPERITEALAAEILNNVKIDHFLEAKSSHGPKVVALVGPTGVGKTTTIAKLASQAILQKNLRVGLINVDSYKVAALDQLATYAKILNVPFRQASNAAELDRALTEFKPLDLVLIDTSGRSQRDSESLVQMKALLAECTAVRPILIMSATTRDQELYDIITRFKIFNPTGLVFSKLDETATFGCIYNISQKTGLPLNYFTVGQRVPEDIEPASRERVAGLILDL